MVVWKKTETKEKRSAEDGDAVPDQGQRNAGNEGTVRNQEHRDAGNEDAPLHPGQRKRRSGGDANAVPHPKPQSDQKKKNK